MTLTDEQVDSMPAGPEIDRLVAEAIGCTLRDETSQASAEWRRGGHFFGFVSRDGCDGEEIFAPSTDWNSAMLAAEIADECESIQICGGNTEKPTDTQRKYWELGRDVGYWYCSIGHAYVYADTGPLAVCRAILGSRRPINADEKSD